MTSEEVIALCGEQDLQSLYSIIQPIRHIFVPPTRLRFRTLQMTWRLPFGTIRWRSVAHIGFMPMAGA